MQATDIGITAFVDPTHLLGWATALEDGAPLADVDLQIHPAKDHAATSADGLARIELGNSGPVKRSGIVMLEAAKGGRIVAIPRKGSVVLRAPGEDEDDFGDDEDRPTIPLKDGGFRMSSGTRYEIKGTGLVFWYK